MLNTRTRTSLDSAGETRASVRGTAAARPPARLTVGDLAVGDPVRDATRTEQFEQFKYGNSGNVQMYHTHVWRQIDQAIVVPAVARFPALQRGVDLATGWFNK